MPTRCRARLVWALGQNSQQIDPVCGMTVDPAHAAAHRRYGGRDHSFCCAERAESFDDDPKRYLVSEP
ncbi:MAG: YHS domain-containing protein [Acidimicrobiales bacterium]